RHRLQAEVVGLLLVVTRVLELRRLRRRDRTGREDRIDGGEQHADQRRHVPRGARALHADDVMRVGVADLVAKHSGQLVLVVRVRDQAGVDEDVPARNGERVQDGTLDDVEVIVELLWAERLDEALPELPDVVVDRRVLGQRQLRARLEEEAATEVPLASVARLGPRIGRQRQHRGQREGDERVPPPRHAFARRATSRAKYVTMMSAPARRIASRVSSTTRSSSSQPRAAAALTIEYSPLT